MKKLSKNLSYLGYVALAAAPYLVSAQAVGSAPTTISGVWEFMCTLFNWLFILVMFAAVVYIILAAWNYLTASGDGKKIEKANHMLLYAVIGVVVAIMAKNIPRIAASVVGLSAESVAGSSLPSCLR